MDPRKKSRFDAILTVLHTIFGLGINGFLFIIWWRFGRDPACSDLGGWLFGTSIAGFCITIIAAGLVWQQGRKKRLELKNLLDGVKNHEVSIIFRLGESLAMNLLCLGSICMVGWLILGNYLVVLKNSQDECPQTLIDVSLYYVNAYYFSIGFSILNIIRRNISSNGLPCFY